MYAVRMHFSEVPLNSAQDPYDPHASLYDVDDESTIITLADWWHTPSIAVS